MKIIKRVKSLKTKLTISIILLNKVSEFEEISEYLKKLIASIKILSHINSRNLKKQLISKINNPIFIINFLIENRKIGSLIKNIEILKIYLEDNQILEKAQNILYEIFQNSSKDIENYPDFLFFEELICMCSDKDSTAETCLKIADKLSTLILGEFNKNYRVILLEFIRKTILLSRRIFKLIDGKMSLNVIRCQKYLNFLGVLESLSKVNIFYFFPLIFIFILILEKA